MKLWLKGKKLLLPTAIAAIASIVLLVSISVVMSNTLSAPPAETQAVTTQAPDDRTARDSSGVQAEGPKKATPQVTGITELPNFVGFRGFGIPGAKVTLSGGKIQGNMEVTVAEDGSFVFVTISSDLTYGDTIAFIQNHSDYGLPSSKVEFVI